VCEEKKQRGSLWKYPAEQEECEWSSEFGVGVRVLLRQEVEELLSFKLFAPKHVEDALLAGGMYLFILYLLMQLKMGPPTEPMPK
jgi:hypothetical protein